MEAINRLAPPGLLYDLFGILDSGVRCINRGSRECWEVSCCLDLLIFHITDPRLSTSFSCSEKKEAEIFETLLLTCRLARASRMSQREEKAHATQAQ